MCRELYPETSLGSGSRSRLRRRRRISDTNTDVAVTDDLDVGVRRVGSTGALAQTITVRHLVWSGDSEDVL